MPCSKKSTICIVPVALMLGKQLYRATSIVEMHLCAESGCWQLEDLTNVTRVRRMSNSRPVYSGNVASASLLTFLRTVFIVRSEHLNRGSGYPTTMARLTRSEYVPGC